MIGRQIGTTLEDGPCKPDIDGILRRLAPHLRSLEFMRLVWLTISLVVPGGSLAVVFLIWSHSGSLMHAIIYCFIASVFFFFYCCVYLLFIVVLNSGVANHVT